MTLLGGDNLSDFLNGIEDLCFECKFCFTRFPIFGGASGINVRRLLHEGFDIFPVLRDGFHFA